MGLSRRHGDRCLHTHRLFNRVRQRKPSRAMKVMERFVWDSVESGTLRQSHGLARNRYEDICRSVVRLRDSVRPNAVARLVVTKSVLSFERESSGRTPHVREEFGKAASPFVAHHNSLRSVNSEAGIVFVVTTTLGVRPCAVFLGAGLAVLRISENGLVMRQTSATSGIPALECSGVRGDHLSAVAPALPNRFVLSARSPSGRSFSDNGQSTKLFTKQVVLHGRN